MNSTEISELTRRVNRIGMILSIIVPIVVLAGGYIAMSANGILPRNSAATEETKLLIYLLFGMSIFEPLAGFFVKRQILSRKSISDGSGATLEQVAKFLNSAYIPVFSLAMSASINGVVCYLLGADLVYFVIMVAISLIGFFVLRANESEIEMLSKKITGEK